MRDQSRLAKGLACLQPLWCPRLTPPTHTHTTLPNGMTVLKRQHKIVSSV